MTKINRYCSATPRSSDATTIRPNMKTVMTASRRTVEICEILFCRMLMVLARIMINGILQISAGWMENGRKLNASQERLPLRVSPKGNSRRMKIAEKISSSSRRSAMISTSTSVKKTYKIIPRTSARICVRTYCALPLTFVALEMTTMPKTLAAIQRLRRIISARRTKLPIAFHIPCIKPPPLNAKIKLENRNPNSILHCIKKGRISKPRFSNCRGFGMILN